MDVIREEADRKAASVHTREERERASAEVFRNIANTCKPRSVRMVEDIPLNHQSGYLPILDTQMCIIDGKVVYRHFRKPMSSLEVVTTKSAMSLSSKMNILTQEGGRRLRNCSKDITEMDKMEDITKLMI